jgi:DNA repair protein RadC
METKSFRKIKLNHFETSPELAEIKVSYKSKQKNKVRISTSLDAFNVLYPLYDKETIELQEQFFLLLLNRMNIVLGWIKLSAGGTAGTIVDPKMVFGIALQTNACGIMLSHNHPSGNLLPSKNDVALTHNIVNSGKLLEITLLDHLIISPDEKYYSFADDGNMC